MYIFVYVRIYTHTHMHIYIYIYTYAEDDIHDDHISTGLTTEGVCAYIYK